MQAETKKTRRDRGDGGLFRLGNSQMWYTKVRGKRQSTGTTVKEEAKKTLQARQGRVSLGLADPVEQRKIKYEDVRDTLLADYANGPQNGRSLVTKADGTQTVWGLNHLNKFFGGYSVVDINTKLLREFISFRQNMGAQNGTVNR